VATGRRYEQITFKASDFERATISAMNRAARTALTAASAKIREKFNFKKKDLDTRIRIVSPARKGRESVTIRVVNEEVQLYKFQAKQIGKPGRSKRRKGSRLKQGVKATVTKRDRKLFRSSDKKRGSFLATMRSGHTGVFIRSSTDFSVNKKGKLVPMIRELFGLRLTSLFSPVDGESTIIDLLEKIFIETFEKRLMHELNRKLSK
jgi:hypothetical protein